MPFRVRRIPVSGDQGDFAIQKRENGQWRVVGRSNSREDAVQSARIRAAGEGTEFVSRNSSRPSGNKRSGGNKRS